MTIPPPNTPPLLDFLEEEITQETRLKLHQWLAVVLVEYIRHHKL